MIRVDVGLDPKALLEAWNAIQKQHPKLPVIMFSTDQGVDTSRSQLCTDVRHWTLLDVKASATSLESVSALCLGFAS